MTTLPGKIGYCPNLMVDSVSCSEHCKPRNIKIARIAGMQMMSQSIQRFFKTKTCCFDIWYPHKYIYIYIISQSHHVDTISLISPSPIPGAHRIRSCYLLQQSTHAGRLNQHPAVGFLGISWDSLGTRSSLAVEPPMDSWYLEHVKYNRDLKLKKLNETKHLNDVEWAPQMIKGFLWQTPNRIKLNSHVVRVWNH